MGTEETGLGSTADRVLRYLRAVPEDAVIDIEEALRDTGVGSKSRLLTLLTLLSEAGFIEIEEEKDAAWL